MCGELKKHQIEGKTMQLDSIVTETAKHLIEMQKVPAFFDHANQRFLELVKDNSGLFRTLPAEIKRLKEMENDDR